MKCTHQRFAAAVTRSIPRRRARMLAWLTEKVERVVYRQTMNMILYGHVDGPSPEQQEEWRRYEQEALARKAQSARGQFDEWMRTNGIGAPERARQIIVHTAAPESTFYDMVMQSDMPTMNVFEPRDVTGESVPVELVPIEELRTRQRWKAVLDSKADDWRWTRGTNP